MSLIDLLAGRPEGTEFDILKSEGGKLSRRGKVLSYSDFSTGYDGWAELFSAGMLRQPISLSTEIGGPSSDTVLKLSTAEKAYVSATDAVAPNDADSLLNASAYKRLNRPRAGGLISISGFVAMRSGGVNDQQPVMRTIGLGLDMQKQDNSSRAFPRMYYRGYFASDGSGTARLDIQGNSGLLAVTGSSNTGPGQNEGKGNLAYLRLTYDLDANGGLGGYYEAQANQTVFDLTGFGTERGSQTPQNTTNKPQTDFRGGLNGALFVQRNTDVGTIAQFPAVGFFSNVCITIGDSR